MDNSQQVKAAIQARYGTQDPNKLDLRRWDYYDYSRYPVGGTTSLRFFNNPIGVADPVSTLTKTQEQTNLRRSGQFEYPLIITQVRTHIYLLPKVRQASGIQALTALYADGSLNGVMEALHDLSQVGVLQITFGQKLYQQIPQPFVSAPPGAGIEVTQIPANNTGSGTFPPLNLLFQQSPVESDVWNQDPVLFVEKDQTLYATIDFPHANSPAIPQVASANVAVDIGIHLSGFAIFPAQ